MNKYVGTWKLVKVASFSENGLCYIPVAEFSAQHPDDDIAKQLGCMKVCENGIIQMICSFADAGLSKDDDEVKKALEAGEIILIDDDHFSPTGEKDVLHWELRDGDKLWADCDTNEEGKCFCCINSEDEPDCLDLMVMFRYAKVD